MKVYVYWHGNRNSSKARLLNYCAESWRRYGWDFQVLNESHVPQDDFTKEYLTKTKAYPRGGSWEDYEKNCYNKWLALKAVGGGLVTEWDVINYGVEPVEPITDLERWGVNYFGVTYAEGEGLDLLINELMNNGMKYSFRYNNNDIVGDHFVTFNFDRVHVRRDMFHHMPWDFYPDFEKNIKVTEVIKPNLNKPLVIHYSNGWQYGTLTEPYQPKMHRVDAIKHFEKEYLNDR
jgi:hypothetical protein